jgi:hypothetical protein
MTANEATRDDPQDEDGDEDEPREEWIKRGVAIMEWRP